MMHPDFGFDTNRKMVCSRVYIRGEWKVTVVGMAHLKTQDHEGWAGMIVGGDIHMNVEYEGKCVAVRNSDSVCIAPWRNVDSCPEEFFNRDVLPLVRHELCKETFREAREEISNRVRRQLSSQHSPMDQAQAAVMQGSIARPNPMGGGLATAMGMGDNAAGFAQGAMGIAQGGTQKKP